MSRDNTRFRKTYSYYRQPPITSGVCCPTDGTSWEDWYASLELFYQWPERGPAEGDNRLITSASVGLIGQMGVSGSASAADAEARFGDAWDELSAQSFGSDIYFYVSGSLNGTDKTVHGGSVLVSGSVTALLGLSGSLTRLSTGAPAFLAGTGISILSSSNGAIIISATGGGSGSIGSGSAVEPRTKYIMPQAGAVDADGTLGNPYNYTSAAALGKAGPWQQAIEALQAMDISDRPGSGRTIFAMGGDYGSESVNIIDADAPWFIYPRGAVQFSGAPTFTYTALAGVHLYAPHLMIIPDGSGALVSDGSLLLGDALGSSWSVILTECYFDSVGVSGALVANPLCYLDHCSISSTFNVPNIKLYRVEQTQIYGATTVKEIARAAGSGFQSVTVTSVPTGNDAGYDAGFVDCGWSGTPYFDGPEGSALFDPITKARFVEAGGTYADPGATEYDVLRVGHLISNEPAFIVKAEAGSIDVQAVGVGNTATFSTSDGQVNIEANGTDRPVLVTTADGTITIDANNFGSDTANVIIEADNSITLQANDDINGTAGGLIFLDATEQSTMRAGAAYTSTVMGGAATLSNLDGDSFVTVNADTWIKVSSIVSPVILETRENADFRVNGASGPTIPVGASIVMYADNIISGSSGRGITLGTTASSPSTADIDITTHWGDINLTAGSNSGNGSVVVSAPYQIILDSETGIKISSGEGDIIVGGVAGAVRNIDIDVDSNITMDAQGSISITSVDDTTIDATNIVLTTPKDDSGAKVFISADETHVDGRLYSSAGSGSVGSTTTTSAPTAGNNRVFRVPNVLSMSGTLTTPIGSGVSLPVASIDLPLYFWGTDGSTPVARSLGQTIKGSAHFDLIQPASSGNNRKAQVWLGITKLFETDAIPAGAPQTKSRLEFEIWLTDKPGYDVAWWYRWSANVDTVKGSVAFEEDSGYSDVSGLTSTLSMHVDCDVDNEEMIFTGWRVWSLHT